MINLYDHEVLQIEAVLNELTARAQSRREYAAFDREIKEKVAAIGFVATVNWFTAAGPDNVPIPDMLMPEITIDGRIAPDGRILAPEDFAFDHNQQVHEVTHDMLGLGEEASSVIKTGAMDTAHRDTLAAHKNHKH